MNIFAHTTTGLQTKVSPCYSSGISTNQICKLQETSWKAVLEVWQISLCLSNLSNQFLSKLHLFTDTQSHAAFALQLLSSSPCLTRWCYWLYKNKDLPAKEENVLNRNVLQCVLILLVTRCLTVFYMIKFLPFQLLLYSRLSLCSSNLILLSIGDTILVLFCTCLWNLLMNTTSCTNLTYV